MAHRNIKITRDIVQTCNKLRAFNKLEQCTVQPHKSVESSKNASHNVQSNKIHHSAPSKNEVTNPNIIISEVNASRYVNGNAGPAFLEPIVAMSEREHTHKGRTLNAKNFGTELTAPKNVPLPFITGARFYSSSKKRPGEPPCMPSKKCVRNPNCPKFSIEDCTPSRGSDCKRLYQDPCCAKKMAPYPSYSELCAFRLEDDPSECQQCPWQRCRGVDDIKPQGRKYHTSTKEMNMAMIPSKNTNVFPFIFQKQCDASKEPCKEPPPKCKKEEKVKKDCPEKKKKKEKKCDTLLLAGHPWLVTGSLRNLALQTHYNGTTNQSLLQEHFGEPQNLAQRIITYRLKDCPDNKRRCPKVEILPPNVDHTIDNGLDLMFAKEHDKGHPPPCEPKSHPESRQCPSDSPKKKYRKERDLNEAEYRRIPKPYPDDDRKK